MINRNTHALHALGQSLWLDNITRDMLADGTLARYIAELSVTGLTSNPRRTRMLVERSLRKSLPTVRRPPDQASARPANFLGRSRRLPQLRSRARI